MIVGRYSSFHRLQHALSPWTLGADVGHASPGVHRPSLASVVFSVDITFSRYRALARLQQGRMETIADLKMMMVVSTSGLYAAPAHFISQEAIGVFKGTNGIIPERIIFLRDGVSEGEFSRVRDTEVAAIHGEWPYN